MSRSIFDPEGGQAEGSGTRFTPPDAISHLPEAFNTAPAGPETGEPSPELQQLAAEELAHEQQVKPAALHVISENDGKLLLVHLTGALHKDDYRDFVPIVEQAVQRHGKIRLLVEMHDFYGWDPGALWEDLKFDFKHFNDIERLAMVGEKKWEEWMATFCKPFTTATIRYFPKEQAADVRSGSRPRRPSVDASRLCPAIKMHAHAERPAIHAPRLFDRDTLPGAALYAVVFAAVAWLAGRSRASGSSISRSSTDTPRGPIRRSSGSWGNWLAWRSTSSRSFRISIRCRS